MPTRRVVLAAVAGFTAIAAATATLVVFAATSATVPGGRGLGGPFTLVDDTGATVTETALRGKPSLIYFGYTFCPEVCPTTLSDMSRWIKQLGPDADRFNYVFITVDPQRDTETVMHDYVTYFDKRIRGFTGTPEQIAKVAREYRVYYRKVPTDDGGYLMDHSAVIYLMGADEEFVSVIAYQENDASALAKLRNLLNSSPPS